MDFEDYNHDGIRMKHQKFFDCLTEMRRNVDLHRFGWKKLKDEATLGCGVLQDEVYRLVQHIENRVGEYVAHISATTSQECAGWQHLEAVQFQCNAFPKEDSLHQMNKNRMETEVQEPLEEIDSKNQENRKLQILLNNREEILSNKIRNTNQPSAPADVLHLCWACRRKYKGEEESPVIEKPCKEGAANFKFFQPKLTHENLKESEGMLNSLTDIIQGHKLRLGLGDSHERRGHRVHREQSHSRRSPAKTAKSLPSLPMKDTNTSGQRTFGLDAAKVNEEHVEREKQRIRNLLKNRSRPFDFHF
ncbi:hypothetical protein CAPTEDRAFT_207060 [Capitella teleta]|uniref:Uncharacterized protein n=1 Tax=Capitella teleta TaxID=283909 RepID=R7VFP5_CAPTE|nr:hypothetical protein CAPTEDRAFT_207060 [Capitella teleta]|eukprot:ELU17397.1 hypothetical protein CAPTEDRAFT_207060 [Capitella teleta]